jgi:hypothetical protein
MPDNGPKPDESLCPYWQKRCSEGNPGKVVCKKLMTVMGMLPTDIAPHPVPMCQDDFTLGLLQKILQTEMTRSVPSSQQLPRGLLKPR